MMETAVQTPKTPTDPAAGSPPESRPIRRRTRSSSSSASSFSSTSPSPSPSPAHRIFSPLRPSSTIPFSWEHLPGVPKSPKSLPPDSHSATDPRRLLLPLPPPLRSKSAPPSMPRKKRSDARFANLATDDPFAAALAECAKDDPSGTELDKLCGEPAASSRRRRSAAPAITDRFGLLDLYGSCKTSCSVAEATISIPRSITHRAAEYGLLKSRSTS
uniref:LOW QUALITY PROTEIN: pectinesterase inhibitor 10 n=1 Tax=Elaeis guineensis var. tenera TaxID=51953 RepID=A0A6J0PMN2_ELAGV|nr:LOW QUALITY PROTEIN: pectinesterase inhibitor 10 [Elaeis guineensis]